MFSPRTKLETPKNFDFPFEPYAIQDDLMKSLYSVLENKQIGIFESPTGTGKSLTLVTASVKWLFDHVDLINEEIEKEINDFKQEIQALENSLDQDWIKTQSKVLEKKQEVSKLISINQLIKEKEQEIQKIRDDRKCSEKENKSLNTVPKQKPSILSNVKNDEKYLEDSDSEEIEEDEKEQKNENPLPSDVKIFFCSRTHSQLSQVVSEIKRMKISEHVRCISLASRQNLCINPEVRKLNSIHLINEKCLEMQKNTMKRSDKADESPPRKKMRSKKPCKCPFKSTGLVKMLKDISITDILDIEDLVDEAKRVKACPYYSSRSAIKDAQVIMLPYQMLFHRSTRLQSGISLKNNIIIIDEAHNLLDTITSIYSADLEQTQLNAALIQLSGYKEKYFSKFSTKNLLKINQIIFIVKRLIKIMNHENRTKSSMIKSHTLMAEGDFYNINIYEILQFCENTHFAEKVHSFAQRCSQQTNLPNMQSNEENPKQCVGVKGLLNKISREKSAKVDVEVTKTESIVPMPTQNVIRPLLKFLDCLTECPEDGGIIIKPKSTEDGSAAMKFVLLNPALHFKEMIDDCRAIVIAGGTMQPIDELTNQLFANCIERLKVHIYGHVVPPESILPIVVKSGPSNKRFCFNFQNRGNLSQLQELTQTLLNICNIVPAGVVCFVPSYDFLENYWSHLHQSNCLSRIENKKFIFRETKTSTNSDSTEKLLSQYSSCIKDKSRNGALIFSVVGGKLSEGLNFSDDLGRCIIVIGLPYPNKASYELQEKMKYLDATLGSNAGNEYYENLCMKAVNQCIGRSIRHIKDFATVLLIDERFVQERVTKKLPTWIARSLEIPGNYGQIQRSVVQFFKEKQSLIKC